MFNIAQMDMKFTRNIFEKDQAVHVISRAVEERKIFVDKADCFRFIYQMYAANIGEPARNLRRQDIIKIAQAILDGSKLEPNFVIEKHPPLVSFLDFSLVVNHNHLYLISNVDNGIPLYMQKLNTGFAKYFNLRYGRQGALFGRSYRRVIVKTQFQSDAVSRYVSVINTLDVFQPNWRKNGLKKPEEALNFLRTYQFSSFPDKIGERKSKLLAPSEILEKYLTLGSDIKTYKEFVEDFLEEKSVIPREFFLE